MALSGKDGTWLAGFWDLKLPVVGWVVWLADGITKNSRAISWEEVPDRIYGVCVYHSKNRKTWMIGVDSYPDPDGGPAIKLGEQLGALDCKEWMEYRNNMRKEANEWQQYIT